MLVSAMRGNEVENILISGVPLLTVLLFDYFFHFFKKQDISFSNVILQTLVKGKKKKIKDLWNTDSSVKTWDSGFPNPVLMQVQGKKIVIYSVDSICTLEVNMGSAMVILLLG